jgi:hypothetical protein
MQSFFLVSLLLLSSTQLLSAQQQPSIPLTVRLATRGSVLFKPAEDPKKYGILTNEQGLIQQRENRTGVLIFSPPEAKDKPHSPLTIAVLPQHLLDIQTGEGQVQFENIDNKLLGKITGGPVSITGGKANASLQVQTGDITVRQSQWQGILTTGKGNILLEDSPDLEGQTVDGTLTYRYTQASLKEKKEFIQQWDKGRVEVMGSVPMAHLQLLEGEIVIDGKLDKAFIDIRDQGNITAKQVGKAWDVHTRKGTIQLMAETFESLQITCEQGKVSLSLPKSFRGTVRLLSEVVGLDKPQFKVSHFWQATPIIFETVTTEEKGKVVPQYFRYVFEKKLGEDSSILWVRVKNSDLEILPF